MTFSEATKVKPIRKKNLIRLREARPARSVFTDRLRLSWWGLLALMMLTPLLPPNETIAQENNHQNSRQIIIGDMIGRTDPDELEILTGQGALTVSDLTDSDPLQLISQSSNELILRYKKTGDGLVFRHPTQIVYRFYDSERALISALILDEVDFAVLENEKSAEEVRNANDHILPLPRVMTPNTVKLVCYNTTYDLLSSSAVRTAFAYGIDHKRIIENILGGKAHLASGPFDIDSPLITSGLQSYRFNPKKAILLLEEAGWKDTDGDRIRDKDGRPLRFTLYYGKGLSIDEAVAREIKNNLSKIGVDVHPRPMSKSQINAHLRSGEFEAVLMTHTFQNSVESFNDFFSAEGSHNYMGYYSQTLKNYIGFYQKQPDAEKKKTLFKSMQLVVNREQPVNFLYFKWNTHYMINIKKIDNYRDTTARGKIRPFEEWIIKTETE